MRLGQKSGAQLELKADAERYHRVKLIGRGAFVELGLLGNDVGLNGRIGTDGAAVDAAGIAGAAAETQRDARRSLISGADLEGSAEVPVAGYKIAEADENHWRGFVNGELTGPGDGIGGIAEIIYVAQGKALAAGHGSVRRDLVAVVNEYSGTDVELFQEEKIIGRLSGAQVERAFVGHAVFIKGVPITERVETKAHVGAVANRQRNLSANAQHRDFDAYADGNASLGRSFRGSCRG